MGVNTAKREPNRGIEDDIGPFSAACLDAVIEEREIGTDHDAEFAEWCFEHLKRLAGHHAIVDFASGGVILRLAPDHRTIRTKNG